MSRTSQGLSPRAVVVAAASIGITTFSTSLAVPAANATWVSNHCNNNSGVVSAWIYRSDAESYAVVGAGEGYEWGGGCWNNNNTDDTPNAPDSDGEGGDCSGFTFKAWGLALNQNSTTVYSWDRFTDEHGPWQAWEFKAGVGIINTKGKSYSTTKKMDAFASSSHIGMLYSEGSDGYDQIIEAKGDAAGTGIWSRNYRTDSSYGGVGRSGWGSD